MDSLDKIPWNDLTHAYGSAGDVPELLRALRVAPADVVGEESPLWQLFGNIWHQGTIYEATAYAVPFLIELACDRQVPNRVGILSLLAEIANGSSYWDVRGNRDNEPNFEEQKRQELQWVQQAHDAVAAGFESFVELTKEPGDVACAAAYVLAQLPSRKHECAAILRRLLQDERRASHRAGLLLLFGLTGDQEPESRRVLSDTLQATTKVERHAAAHVVALLNMRPAPSGAREVIMEAIVASDLERELEDLPWYAANGLDLHTLYAYLDEPDREQVIDGILTSMEAGEAPSHQVEILINLLFPLTFRGPAPKVTASAITAQQLRAIRAIYQAAKGGKRMFYVSSSSYGLPDTIDEWRKLAGE